jgi:hypothetical protein
MTNQLLGMHQQVAGHSVIEELLRQQAGVPKRNWFGRLVGGSPLGAESQPWYRGALGEIAVGRILATLPPEWTVFHALPVGKKGADIDHLVIGPGGIFTINTKNHSGKKVWVAGQTLMVSGQKQKHIPNADFEATRVTKILRERMPSLPAAQPVLAVLDPTSLSVKAKPDHTTVLTAARLRRWMVKRPVVLSSEELAELAMIVDDPASWAAPLFPPTENARLRFAELHAAVRGAARRRMAVTLLSTAAVVGALWLAMPMIGAVYIEAVTGL